jgi:hypothetical protein
MNSIYRGLSSGTLWGIIFGPFFAILVVGLFLFVVKWLLIRSWDGWYATGYAGLVIASALIMRLATTSAWESFATRLLR